MTNLTDTPPITKEEIELHAEHLLNDEQKGLFTVKPVNSWMEDAKKRKVPKMLLGEFWREGELCIEFADTGLGKSIKAVQAGNSISAGIPIPGLKLEVPAQKVLYCDFELSDKQFEARYSIDYTEHYRFNDNFLRAEINPDAAIPKEFETFEDYFNYSLEVSIIETGAKVIIIDNITYLKDETEKAKAALPLMKHLQALKKKHSLSMLVLAHTPKRDLSKPITRNDLQGSKMLINFCDSAFAIGESTRDAHVRYLKQIKVRSSEMLYDSENIVVCQLQKPSNFLQFSFMGFGKERDHLRQWTEEERNDLKVQVKQLSESGHSQREIAKELSISVGVVNKYLNND